MTSKLRVSIAEALKSVTAESETLAQERSQQRTRMDDELAALKRAQTNITAQIAALDLRSKEMIRQHVTVEDMLSEQGQRVVFEALLKQQQMLKVRSHDVAERGARRESDLFAELASSQFAAEFQEYRQFKEEIEPTLSSLPASYRSVVLRHHHEVSHRLIELVEKTLSAPVEIEDEHLALDVVLSIDPFEVGQLAVTIILPVSGSFADHWEHLSDDVEMAFAYRVAQGVYTMLVGTAMQTQQLVVGQHEGLLVFEVDLAHEGSAEDFTVALSEKIEGVLNGAGELRGAHVSGVVYAMDADILFPESASYSIEDAPTERATNLEGQYV